MSGLICLATIELLIQTLAFPPLADPTPPNVDFIVIDDFESYTDESPNRIYQTWIDGWEINPPPPGHPPNGSGSTVGHIDPPFAEQGIVHGGHQSMPMDYNNLPFPWYSEADRFWETPQDWTAQGMNTPEPVVPGRGRQRS